MRPCAGRTNTGTVNVRIRVAHPLHAPDTATLTKHDAMHATDESTTNTRMSVLLTPCGASGGRMGRPGDASSFERYLHICRPSSVLCSHSVGAHTTHCWGSDGYAVAPSNRSVHATRASADVEPAWGVVKPTSTGVHLEEPSEDANEPCSHSSQLVWLGLRAYFPTPHAEQMPPTPALPGAHGVHAAWLLGAASYPSGHGVQTRDPGRLKCPVSQSWHAVSPLEGAQRPAVHSVHTVACVMSEKEPASQGAHSRNPATLEYFPRMHGMQLTGASGWTGASPAGQALATITHARSHTHAYLVESMYLKQKERWLWKGGEGGRGLGVCAHIPRHPHPVPYHLTHHLNIHILLGAPKSAPLLP